MNRPAEIFLTPFSALYSALARARAMAYRRGLFTAQIIPTPVFSVGNLTTGGTGKTPLVAWIARVLAEEQRRVCVLTRGYGRANPRERVLVSDGNEILADTQNSGDEPRWLAETLLGQAAVLADRNRVAAAQWAMAKLASDCFVLDDGFQHLRLARSGDLVTIDATNPWGGGYLLPRGRLREPLTALRRASACVITRADQAENLSELVSQVTEISGGRPVFTARTKVSGVRPLAPDSPEKLSLATPLLAFCGLGNPKAFFRQVTAAGYTLCAQQSFRDHHLYQPQDLAKLTKKAQAVGAKALLTTAKDAVKLRHLAGDAPIYVLDIELEIERESALRDLLRSILAAQDRS